MDSKFVLGALLGVFFVMATAMAADCVDLTGQTNLRVTKSITICPGTAGNLQSISFDADHVVLDCQGESVGSITSGAVINVWNRHDVTIKNCVTYKRNIAIEIHNSQNIVLSGNSFMGAWDFAIYAVDSKSLKITGNTMSDAEWQSGIYFSNVQNSVITGNTINHNGYNLGSTWPHRGGIALISSSSNTISGNTMRDNYRSIYRSGGSGNSISGNIICGSTVSDPYSSGKCPPICSSNGQCGTNSWAGADTCDGKDVWNTWKTYTCNSPGTMSSSCSSSTEPKLKIDCLQACSKGVCTSSSGVYVSNTTSQWQINAAGDIDKDGVADIIWQLPSNGQVIAWFLNSDGTKKSSKYLSNTTTSWLIRAAGDIDKDGVADLIWQLPTGQVVVWFLNSNGTMKSSKYILSTTSSWMIKAVSDMDKDGVADLVWQLPTGQVVVWFMKADGTKKSSKDISTVASQWLVKAAGDVDKDGVADLIWQLPSNGQVIVWFMNTDGTKKSSKYASTATSQWLIKAAGDIDKDGVADLVWQLPTGQAVVWFLKPDGIA